MRKYFASAIILGASAALSFSVVSPALAAGYPTAVGFHSTVVDVGLVKGPVIKVVAPVAAKRIVVTATLAKPADVIVSGFKANAIVTSTVVIGGKKVVLPKLTVGKNGKLDTKALVFKVPGKYVITYTSGGVTKTIAITVKA